MDEEYDSFFGFTESEVKAMLSYYGVSDKEEELKDWYDGYLFGSEEIYNPWSVINYISKGCLPQAYWVNTGKNEILDDVLRVATDDITERLYDLLQGERVVARIDQNVVYRSLAEDPANIYSLLLVAGYLKTPKKELQADGSYLCEVSIPNREIAAVYKSEILSHFLQTGAITRTTVNKIAESLYANDYKKLQSAIGEYMDKSISFFDGGAEGFYHGLMLGLIALMDNQYKIKSNRESGDGRFDVSLIPREKRYPGIILELKWKEKLSDVELEKWSNEALKQIGELRYDSEMKEDGITEILKFGIAFSGKKVCVRIMDMRGVKPKDIQEYLGFGCVQSVYRWLDGVSMPTVDNLYAISKMLQVPMDSIVCGNAGRTKSQMDACLTDQERRVYTYYKKMRELNAA